MVRTEIILFLCLCAVLVVPVSAATWYDDFSSDTSGNYSGDTGNFVWGPTNLSGNIANSQAHINSTSYGYGRYLVFLSYSGDSQSGIVLSSDSDTETGYPLNKGNKYFIGIKNDWWANPDGLILYKIVAGGDQ